MKLLPGFVCMFASLGAIILSPEASAQVTTSYHDLVNTSFTEVTIGAGRFRAELLPGTSGTGNFDSFLRLNGSPVETGYNTSAPNVLDNQDSRWTHDLHVGELSMVQDLYGRYLVSVGMDLNEPNADGARYQSLDVFQVYVSPEGSKNTTNPSELGILIYDMDSTEDNALLLDVNRNASGGSGRSDLNIYLDLDLFGKAQHSDYVYFYMKMGGVGLGVAPQYPNLDFSNDGGFDELRRDTSLQTIGSPVIPEPGTAMLFMLTSIGLIIRRSRR